MTIRIPIGADPSGAVQGFEQIRAAIQRAGQAGRQFSELDLSHPELKDFADDIRTVRDQFEAMKRISGGLRTRLSATGQSGAAPWDVNYNRMYEDPGNAARARNRAASFATTGTQFYTGGVPPTGDGSSRGGSLPFPVSGGSMAGMLKFGLGLAGIGGITALVSKAASQGSSEAIAVDDLQRSTGDLITEFDTFSSRIRHLGEGLGVASTEAIKLASVYARASAEKDVGGSTRGAIGFARGFGMTPAMSAQFFGQMRFAGASGEGRQGQRELAAMIADAVGAGGMWAKTSEVMAQLQSFVSTSERTMVRAPNMDSYLSMTAAMNASTNAPGLRGSGGAALISQIDAAIRGGGRFGEAGQMFMYRAVSREGAIDPFQMRLLSEQGIFGTRNSAGISGRSAEGHSREGKTTIQLVMNEMGRRYANPLQKADATANLLGISMTQALALQDMKPSSYGALGGLMRSANIDLKNVKGSSLRELAAIADPGTNLGGIRDRYMGSGLTGHQKTLIQGKEGEDLRKDLAQIAAERGMIPSEGSKTRSSIARLETAIGDVGTKLYSPLNEMRNFLTGAPKVVEGTFDMAVERTKRGEGVLGRAVRLVTPRTLDEIEASGRTSLRELQGHLGQLPMPGDMPSRGHRDEITSLAAAVQTIKLEGTFVVGENKKFEATVEPPTTGSMDPANAPGAFSVLF